MYDALLTTGGGREYRSVAWARSERYWQDPPGQQSMRANYDAIDRGVLIERAVILPSDIWPPGQRLPSGRLLPWILEQHEHGVWVTLCREADIDNEPDLPQDFGIYGDRAVGVHVLDAACHTVEFQLFFREEEVRLAEERWKKLGLHAIPLQDLLDDEDHTS